MRFSNADRSVRGGIVIASVPKSVRERLFCSVSLRRWLVERFFAWIQWQRRILVRWKYHTHNFLGFVQLACLVIVFRRF